jgi:SsrA-binding protein
MLSRMTTYVSNKKAHFDYEILERFEAGLVLHGYEVKAIRGGKANLQGAYVVVRGGEAYLVGCSIAFYQEKNTPSDYEPDRVRKLLLSKKELAELEAAEDKKGFTLIPLNFHTAGRHVKLELGIARGKKEFDKRESIKKRDTDRDLKRELNWHG